MALSNLDRDLLKRCLAHQAGSWNEFVDRFLGLIYHVISHTAHQRSTPLQPEDVEDLASVVMMQIIAGDYTLLRQFRGQCNLATYLTVIARRICVHELARKHSIHEFQPSEDGALHAVAARRSARHSESENREEVEKMLAKLARRERDVVRLALLEGRSYEEVSTELNIPVNSIGAILSRAKKRLRAGKPESKGDKHPKGSNGDGATEPR